MAKRLSRHSFSASFLLLALSPQLMVSIKRKFIFCLKKIYNKSCECTMLKFVKGARLPRLSSDLLVGGDWSQFNGKIVGGSEAFVGEFPFQISLQRNSGLGWSHSCGGSIFNEKTILNAAHCVSGYT